MTTTATTTAPPFDGATYDPEQDGGRLGRQLDAVKYLMLDGRWRTLQEIAQETACPEASVSARLRDLRKKKWGGFTVDRRHVRRGLYQYRVVVGQVEMPL